MALTVAEILDKVVGREDTRTSINSMIPKLSAVGRLLDANGNPIRQVSTPTLAYTTLTDPTFGTWDNSSAKDSQSLAGDVGEVSAATAYAIVAYPKNYEDDIASFTQQFTLAMANGFAKYIDDRVLNTASTGIIPLASGVGNRLVNTVSGATTFQLYSDLISTFGIVNADGYSVNGVLTEVAENANILNALSTTGQPVFSTDANGNIAKLVGRPYAETYVNLAQGARFVVGDWSKVTVAYVTGLTFEKFTSGSVNISGTEYNLIERNMIAVRAEARMMFKVTQSAAFAFLYG